MFDIGASEIFVIAVVALIVIGPERLPRVAKTVGHLFGRLQRYVSEVKSDINREIELEELRKLKATMQDAARTIEQSVTSQVNYIDSEVKQAGAQVQEQIESAQKQMESGQKQVESAIAPVTGIQLMPPATPVSETPATSPADPKLAEISQDVSVLQPDKQSTSDKPG
jgi:sec-independent protein translocase protein TatB